MAQPADTITDDDFDAFIASIYRGSTFVPADAFREWALLQLRELVPFDSALWGSGRRETLQFHTQTLLNLDDAYTRKLEQTTAVNPVWDALLASPDEPVDSAELVADAQFYASRIYHECFACFGIERLLATLHKERQSGLLTLVSIYRNDRTRRFTDNERHYTKRAVRHLVNAASHAFFTYLIRTSPDEKTHAPAAVCDAQGFLYEIQPQFLDLLDEQFPQWRGSRLPFDLPETGETFSIDGICGAVEAFMDMYVVQAWQEGPLDRLTERESRVVDDVCRGLSFKDIARDMGVAVSTVSNHLYRIYRKLGINNRSSLARLLDDTPIHAKGVEISRRVNCGNGKPDGARD